MIYLPRSLDPSLDLPISREVAVTHGGHPCPSYRASYCQGMFVLCQTIHGDWFFVASWPVAGLKPGTLAIDLGQAWIAEITPVIINRLKEVTK